MWNKSLFSLDIFNNFKQKYRTKLEDQNLNLLCEQKTKVEFL